MCFSDVQGHSHRDLGEKFNKSLIAVSVVIILGIMNHRRLNHLCIEFLYYER